MGTTGSRSTRRSRTRPRSAPTRRPASGGSAWCSRRTASRGQAAGATSSSWNWWWSPNRNLYRRTAAERLEDDAVALGQLYELGEAVLVGVVLHIERKPDCAEADRYVLILGHPERAAEVEVALSAHAAGHVDSERGRDRGHRDPGTGNQRLEQHVARAGEHPRAASRRVQPRLDERPTGRDRARDVLVLERTLCFERDNGRL